MESVAICKMEAENLDSIASLTNQLGYPTSLEEIKSRFNDIQNESGYGLFVATLENDTVVGYIQVNLEPKTLLSGPRADIAALVVDETARRKGIGASLLREAEKWAKEKGLPRIRVRSNTKRKEAHQFYQKNGYILDKSSHVFIKSI